MGKENLENRVDFQDPQLVLVYSLGHFLFDSISSSINKFSFFQQFTNTINIA